MTSPHYVPNRPGGPAVQMHAMHHRMLAAAIQTGATKVAATARAALAASPVPCDATCPKDSAR